MQQIYDKAKLMTRGAYTHKQARSGNDERSHKAGNPRKASIQKGNGDKCGFKMAIDRFFEDRSMDKPSVSRILQTRGVEIGVKKWVRKKQS
jgi:hypothetical protein